MKIKYVVLGIIVGAVSILFYTYGKVNEGQERQQDIANQIIRMHVVANSDTNTDQKLKRDVKDKVVGFLRKDLAEASDVNEARTMIRSKMGEIEEVANEEMKRQGFAYEAKAMLTFDEFPVKRYGDMTFPAGRYEALEVKLGESKGHNWWCVMYPTLCFVDNTYQVVPNESKEVLKKSLTSEEYQSLIQGDDSVTFDFKLAEWLDNLL